MAASLTAREEAVLALLDPDEIVELAVALVRAEGENPPGGEAATVAVLEDACRSRGLVVDTAEVEPGRANLTADFPGGDAPGLLLLGHTDVVPVGEGWTTPPFSGEVRDGRLHGRGSADMKGGLAACVTAMAALRRAGVELAGPVQLAATVDEEDLAKGIQHRIATDLPTDYVGCIVAEPTDLQTIIAARGDAYLDFVVEGRAAHSGKPSDGRNAIYGATAIISAIEQLHHELASSAHPLVGAPTWSVGLVQGGSGTSTVAARCTISADRRLLPNEVGDHVLADVRKMLDSLDLTSRDLRADVELTMEMPGFETSADDRLVTVSSTAVRDAGGPDLPLAGWTAACDGGFVARDAGVPVVVLGAGSVATQAHQVNESVAIADIVTAARTYALCAMRMLSG